MAHGAEPRVALTIPCTNQHQNPTRATLSCPRSNPEAKKVNCPINVLATPGAAEVEIDVLEAVLKVEELVLERELMKLELVVVVVDEEDGPAPGTHAVATCFPYETNLTRCSSTSRGRNARGVIECKLFFAHVFQSESS